MPNRIIKESICTSDNLNSLSKDAEIFFYRLIVNCDDYGLLDARTQILRSKCFPLKVDLISDDDIGNWLQELSNKKLIFLYSVEDKQYLKMVKWEKHQQVRSKKSKYPLPDSNCNQMISDDSKCPRNPIQSESNPNPNPNPIQSDENEDGKQDAVPDDKPPHIYVLDYFMKKASMPATSPKDYEIAERLSKEISLNIIVKGIDIAFQRFKPKYTKDKIHGLGYCEPAIYEVWEEAKKGGSLGDTTGGDSEQDKSKHKIKVNRDMPNTSKIDQSEFGPI